MNVRFSPRFGDVYARTAPLKRNFPQTWAKFTNQYPERKDYSNKEMQDILNKTPEKKMLLVSTDNNGPYKTLEQADGPMFARLDVTDLPILVTGQQDVEKLDTALANSGSDGITIPFESPLVTLLNEWMQKYYAFAGIRVREDKTCDVLKEMQDRELHVRFN